MSRKELEARQVIEAVRRSISLAEVELPDEFFPAHLSVALLDAVFRPNLGKRTEVIVDRYCRRFRISRLRKDRRELPPPDEQETLNSLIRHYEELGTEAMMDEVLRSRECSPGTKTPKAEIVLGAARALRDIGLSILQSVPARSPGEIEDTLRPLSGNSGCTIRLMLMYLGSKDFVRGDFHLRSFVARAVGRDMVSAAKAEALVRKAAYELILSPRYLDHAIWKLSSPAGRTSRLS